MKLVPETCTAPNRAAFYLVLQCVFLYKLLERYLQTAGSWSGL